MFVPDCGRGVAKRASGDGVACHAVRCSLTVAIIASQRAGSSSVTLMSNERAFLNSSTSTPSGPAVYWYGAFAGTKKPSPACSA